MAKAKFKLNKAGVDKLNRVLERAQIFENKFHRIRNVGSFRKRLGLSPLPAKISLNSTKTNLNKAAKQFTNTNRPIVQRIVGTSLELYHGSTYDEIEKSLSTKGKKKYPFIKTKKADRNFKKNLPKGDKLTKVISYRGFLPYDHMLFRREYRNPRLAVRFNFHWGAAEKFNRFGVVQLTLPGGKKVAAGRMRVGAPYWGLGHEPIGTKPKENATRNDYRVFRRRGYPGRRSPDTVEAGLGMPAYNYIYDESKIGEKIHKKVRKDIDKMVNSVCKSIVRTATDAFSKRS